MVPPDRGPNPEHWRVLVIGGRYTDYRLWQQAFRDKWCCQGHTKYVMDVSQIRGYGPGDVRVEYATCWFDSPIFKNNPGAVARRLRLIDPLSYNHHLKDVFDE